MVREGLFSRAMESVTGGVLLAGFALALGATDFEIGLIAAIPFLAQLVNLPAVLLLARTTDHRRFTVRAALAARLLFFPMALLPLVSLPLRPVHALIPLLVAYAVFASLAGAAWQVWVRDLVPREQLGRYFGRRMALLSVVGLVATLAAGQLVAFWGRAFPERSAAVFAPLFALGGLFGLASVLLLARAPVVPATLERVEVGALLRRPLEDKNFRRVVVFLSAWGFAANFSLPFLSVVLLRTLGYSVSLVVVFAALSTAANILALRLWAPVTDRFGNKPVLALGSSLFLVAMLAWAFVRKEPGALVLAAAALVHVVLGIATAAIDLASNGLVMKLARDEEAAAYLSTASVAKSLATGVAPLLAGLVATFFAPRAFSVRFAWTTPGGETVVTALRFAHYDFLFLVSAILGLYALHRLLGFVEQGEAPPVAVARALRRDVQQFSSVAGMRQFAHVASYLTEAAYRLEQSLDVRRVMDEEDEKK